MKKTELLEQIQLVDSALHYQHSRITALEANLEKSDIASLKKSLALQEKQIEKLALAYDRLSRSIHPHKILPVKP